jgi:hypothetical protein
LKVASILRLMQAGVIAACMQCITILLLTPIIIFYAHPKAEDPQLLADDPTVMSLISFLQLVYLFTAVGVALTRHRFITSTGERIHRASRLMGPSDPDRAANTGKFGFPIPPQAFTRRLQFRRWFEDGEYTGRIPTAFHSRCVAFCSSSIGQLIFATTIHLSSPLQGP